MTNNHIDYLELQATDLSAVKAFYASVFGWEFTDFGPEYTAFDNSGLKGGFAKVDVVVTGGPLPVLYHDDLEVILARVREAGAKISLEIFTFPGGRRFHFIDPAGNEIAIWSDQGLG